VEKCTQPRSYNIEKETLNLVLKYAESHGYILENPAVALKRRTQQKKIPEIPTKEQFKSLVDQLRLDPRSTQAADWVEFAGYSGTRIDEARNVTWSDVDFKADTIRITGDEETGTKNSRQRITPLFPALRAFLEARSGQSDATNLLFPRRTARGTGKTKWTPKQAIASACKKAGLPRFTPHHLRHFFCSNAIEAGIDFKTIAAWLGHQDGGVLVATTYGHLRAEHSIEMARKMTYSATPIPLPELGTTDNSAASTL
jgi:integrase